MEVLLDEANRSSGADADLWLAEALQRCRDALQVATQSDLPQDWAKTQHDLAVVLKQMGDRSRGAAASQFYAQALEGYRNALKVLTKEADPALWALATRNLGLLYKAQGNAAAAEQALADANAVSPP